MSSAELYCWESKLTQYKTKPQIQNFYTLVWFLFFLLGHTHQNQIHFWRNFHFFLRSISLCIFTQFVNNSILFSCMSFSDTFFLLLSLHIWFCSISSDMFFFSSFRALCNFYLFIKSSSSVLEWEEGKIFLKELPFFEVQILSAIFTSILGFSPCMWSHQSFSYFPLL